MKIKQLIITLILMVMPLAGSAQFIGIGAMYADAKHANDVQFAANLSYPVYHKKNSIKTFISSGIDYTGGSSPVSGLNIKPIQAATFLSESLFNNYPFTILVGCDAGYLFNFRHGKDGLVLTPNIYVDYKCFYLKTGYDFNLKGSEQQFFIKIGVGFGMGVIKMFPNTKIW